MFSSNRALPLHAAPISARPLQHFWQHRHCVLIDLAFVVTVGALSLASPLCKASSALQASTRYADLAFVVTAIAPAVGSRLCRAPSTLQASTWHVGFALVVTVIAPALCSHLCAAPPPLQAPTWHVGCWPCSRRNGDCPVLGSLPLCHLFSSSAHQKQASTAGLALLFAGGVTGRLHRHSQRRISVGLSCSCQLNLRCMKGAFQHPALSA